MSSINNVAEVKIPLLWRILSTRQKTVRSE
ncbi:MAG: hypothetical protein ACD_45C00526G0001, partial [uncultured bacterium]